MGKPLSLDLRARIVGAVQRGEGSWEEIAGVFGVGVATVNRLVRRHRQTGSVQPEPHGGGMPRRVDEVGEAVIKELLGERPDLTQAELAVLFEAETGRSVSRSSIARTLTRMGFTRKKSPSSRASRRARRPRRREPTSSKP
jgi:transposase